MMNTTYPTDRALGSSHPRSSRTYGRKYQKSLSLNTSGQSDVISFNIYAIWFSPPFYG